MKQLIALLVIVAATGAAAEDTVGLWWDPGDGAYQAAIPSQMAIEPFTLYIGLHDPTVFSVGGYEVGIVMPSEVLLLGASGPNGWTNFGDAANHLVGYMTPLPANGDPFTILGQIECLSTEAFLEAAILFRAAEPPSIPGHDGAVIADGVDADHLIACGFHGGEPWVFYIFSPDAVEGRSLSSVKALFH